MLHAAPWWVTVSMPTGETDRQRVRQTDGRQTITLCFLLDVASVITKADFLLARYPSCWSNNIIKQLKGTQSIDTKQKSHPHASSFPEQKSHSCGNEFCTLYADCLDKRALTLHNKNQTDHIGMFSSQISFIVCTCNVSHHWVLQYTPITAYIMYISFRSISLSHAICNSINIHFRYPKNWRVLLFTVEVDDIYASSDGTYVVYTGYTPISHCFSSAFTKFF